MRHKLGTRTGLFIGAVICWITAFLILIQAGLPQRADYSGYIVSGDVRVAPEIGASAPPFDLKNLVGESLRLDELRGTPVILNFWATWCEPCRAEMPELEALYQTYRAKGLRIVAINLGDTAADVGQWVDDYGLSFDMALDPQQMTGAIYQLRGQPSTFVISPDGMITHIVYGPATMSGLEAAIAPFFPA